MENSNIYNVCFSPNKETKQIADYYANQLGVPTIDITNPLTRNSLTNLSGDFLILSIPVYSQNIPIPVRKTLLKFNFKFVVINLTYGGYSYGNILKSISNKLSNSTIIGYSLTPTKHSYIKNGVSLDFSVYNKLIERIRNKVTQAVIIPKRLNIYPTFVEKLLTDITFRIKLDQNKCIHCGLCKQICPTNSITDDIVLPKSCIKCAACVNVCPSNAIIGRKSLAVKIYFLKKKRTSVIIR